MDFKRATDALFKNVSHADLAKELGVSIPLIRQARLRTDAAAHRAPPQGWERAVAIVAKRHAIRLMRLAESLGARV